MENYDDIKTYSDREVYYKNKFQHRIDGPAVKYYDGDVEYWVEGKMMSPEEFKLFSRKEHIKDILDAGTVKKDN